MNGPNWNWNEPVQKKTLPKVVLKFWIGVDEMQQIIMKICGIKL